MNAFDPKPSRGYIALPIRHPDGRGGFAARWAVPGMIPALVRDDNDYIARFPDHASALMAAFQEREERLNNKHAAYARKQKTTDGRRPRKLSAAEFSVLLAETNMSEKFLAFIGAWPEKRIQAWVDGVEPVDHRAWLLLELFRNPMNIEIAETLTECAIRENTDA